MQVAFLSPFGLFQAFPAGRTEAAGNASRVSTPHDWLALLQEKCKSMSCPLDTVHSHVESAMS